MLVTRVPRCVSQSQTAFLWSYAFQDASLKPKRVPTRVHEEGGQGKHLSARTRVRPPNASQDAFQKSKISKEFPTLLRRVPGRVSSLQTRPHVMFWACS